MKIRVWIEKTEGGFRPHEIEGRRVLVNVFPRYNFILHESVTEEVLYPFTISEQTSGAKIVCASNEFLAINSAREKLLAVTEDEFEEILLRAIKKRRDSEKIFMDPLWIALDAAGYCLTDLQLADFKASLNDQNFDFKAIE